MKRSANKREERRGNTYIVSIWRSIHSWIFGTLIIAVVVVVVVVVVVPVAIVVIGSERKRERVREKGEEGDNIR